MRWRDPISALPCRWVVLLSVLLFETVQVSAADLVYALTEKGRLSINGTILDSLASNFNPDNATNLQQRWVGLAVDGADRYALRADGQLFKNGRRLYLLQFQPAIPFQWSAMAVGGGDVFAIRADGLAPTHG